MTKKQMTPALVLILCLCSASSAQRLISNLGRVGDAVELKIKQAAPEWEAESDPTPPSPPGSPSADTDKVKIKQWAHAHQRVRIVMVQHRSEEEAASALRKFVKDKKTYDAVRGLGDEAYSWGIRNSIAFRRDNLTVYVSAVVTKDLDLAEAANDEGLARKRAAQAEHDEEATQTKNFARHIAVVLDNF